VFDLLSLNLKGFEKTVGSHTKLLSMNESVERIKLLSHQIDIGLSIVKARTSEIYNLVASNRSVKNLSYQVNQIYPFLKKLFKLLEQIPSTDYLGGKNKYYKNSIRSDLYACQSNLDILLNDLEASAESLSLSIKEKLADPKGEQIYARDIMTASLTIASRYFIASKYQESIHHFERAYTLQLKLIEEVYDAESDIKQAQYLSMSGQAYFILNQIEKAIQHMENAVTIIRKYPNTNAYINDLPHYISKLNFYQDTLKTNMEKKNKMNEVRKESNLGDDFNSDKTPKISNKKTKKSKSKSKKASKVKLV
jgi:tetratricopeptide (TPR) repeat protein